MDCTWIDRNEIFEGYVRDALGPDDRHAFEEHFFGCEACFDKVETYRALQVELRAAADKVPVTPPVFSRTWRWVSVAAAAGLVAMVGLTMWVSRSSAPSPEVTMTTAPAAQVPGVTPAAAAPAPTAPAPALRAVPPPAAPPAVPIAVLARVNPPIYLPVSLRGPRDEAVARFEAGMARYVAKDYAGAIPELQAATRLRPDAPHSTFFLAICHLLAGQLDPAIEGLQKTLALGESPYIEEAHFYLAKARLSQGRLADARAELTRTIERRGRMEAEARRLLAQVDSVISRKR